MRHAPTLHCSQCRRRIGKNKTHFIPDAVPIVLCGLCFEKPSTHDRLYPDCPNRWHRTSDHATAFASRASAHEILAARPIGAALYRKANLFVTASKQRAESTLRMRSKGARTHNDGQLARLSL